MVAWTLAVAITLGMFRLTALLGPVEPFSFALVVLGLTTITVGLFLVARRPGNRIGLLLAIGATMLMAAFACFAIAALRWSSHGAGDLFGGLAVVAAQVLVVPALFLTFPAATILFPDGELPGPRWRWPFRAVAMVIVGSAVIMAVTPVAPSDGLPSHPMPLPLPAWWAELAGGAASVALIVSLLMAALAILVRYRRSNGVERAQVKWLLTALTVSAVLFPLSWTTSIGPGDGALVDAIAALSLTLVPCAIALAVLRYRLYDIDRLISRTLSWAIVSGLLVGVFVAGVIGLQSLLDGVTQGQTVAVAASTLAAFALFQPVRRWVQQVVDRRFDRARYDAERTAVDFAERLRHEVEIERVVADLGDTIGSSLRPSTLDLWLRDRSS